MNFSSFNAGDTIVEHSGMNSNAKYPAKCGDTVMVDRIEYAAHTYSNILITYEHPIYEHPMKGFVVSCHKRRLIVNIIDDVGNVVCNIQDVIHSRFVLTEKLHKFTSNIPEIHKK